MSLPSIFNKRSIKNLETPVLSEKWHINDRPLNPQGLTQVKVGKIIKIILLF